MNKPVIQLEAADIAVVLKMLPHRYPFLMVDRVIDIRGDEHGIGIKNVTINEPHFQGHFPGNPVFPGVLMIEGMAQTAGVLCISGDAARSRSRYSFSPSTRRNFASRSCPATPSNITWTELRDARRCGGIAARQKWPARSSPRPKSAP